MFARHCALLLLMLTTVVTTGCLGGPSFEVGDCVRIEQRTLDHDLKAADCSSAVGTFIAADRVYRVDAVLDGTNGVCPVAGFFPVSFSHGPDGVTYCLVQQS